MNIRLVISTFLFLAILTASCSKIDYSIDPEANIVGEWSLVKTCISDGSSTCSKRDLKDPTINQGLTFTENGEFEIATGSELQTGTYLLTDGNLVEFTVEFPEVLMKNFSLQIRKLSEDEMILNPLCSDPCVNLYKKP